MTGRQHQAPIEQSRVEHELWRLQELMGVMTEELGALGENAALTEWAHKEKRSARIKHLVDDAGKSVSYAEKTVDVDTSDFLKQRLLAAAERDRVKGIVTTIGAQLTVLQTLLNSIRDQT